MKQDDRIKAFILNDIGIEISKLLHKYINNPTLVNTANKETLKRLAEEFAPIYQKYKGTLDGPAEKGTIMIFGFFLKTRIERIPNLQNLL